MAACEKRGGVKEKREGESAAAATATATKERKNKSDSAVKDTVEKKTRPSPVHRKKGERSNKVSPCSHLSTTSLLHTMSTSVPSSDLEAVLDGKRE